MQHRFVLLLFVIGCGGGGGVSIDDLPDKLEDAQCKAAAACGSIEDRATCADAIAIDSGEIATIKAGIEDGTIEYDDDAAAACLDDIGDTTCAFEGFHDDSPCNDIFAGTVATGGACVTDLQCANFGACVLTSACDPDIMCCTGTCMGSQIESPIGGPCNDEMHVCSVDSYCKSSGTGTGTGTCTALLADGAMCDEIDACANPTYCDIFANVPTCVRPAAKGAACNPELLIPCSDSREYCDETMMKCVPRVAPGGTCSNALPCVAYATCLQGTCVADVKAGGACQDAANAPDCAGSLECTNGTCALPPAGPTCMLP